MPQATVEQHYHHTHNERDAEPDNLLDVVVREGKDIFATLDPRSREHRHDTYGYEHKVEQQCHTIDTTEQRLSLSLSVLHYLFFLYIG